MILFLFRRYWGKNNRKLVQKVTTYIGWVRVQTGHFVSFDQLFLLLSFHPFQYKYFQYDEFQRIFSFSGLYMTKNC